MKLSIVATLYQSAPYIYEFHRRASAAALALAGDDYEIILVNDGSPDDSLALAVALCEADNHVKLIDLSRNFGHHKAMMTGLAHAVGERIFLIDSDLEEEPEWLSDFAEQMERECCDVVYGVQAQRKGGLFERWSGRLYYKLVNGLTGMAIPHNIVTARLMTRRYVQALLLHEEREVNIAGLWHITGFAQSPRQVVKLSGSATTYTLRRKMAVLIDSVTAFSNAPLVGIFYFGLCVFVAAACYTGYLVIKYMTINQPVDGYTSIMASIWLLGGLIISFIGVIGIYLSRIFSETKQRPYTIVRQIHSGSSHPHQVVQEETCQ